MSLFPTRGNSAFRPFLLNFLSKLFIPLSNLLMYYRNVPSFLDLLIEERSREGDWFFRVLVFVDSIPLDSDSYSAVIYFATVLPTAAGRTTDS